MLWHSIKENTNQRLKTSNVESYEVLNAQQVSQFLASYQRLNSFFKYGDNQKGILKIFQKLKLIL